MTYCNGRVRPLTRPSLHNRPTQSDTAEPRHRCVGYTSFRNMQKFIAGVLNFAWVESLLAGSAPRDQASCAELGGAWGKFGLLEIEQCNLPTNDANNVCSDSFECEGVCFTDEQFPSGTKVNGRCYSKTITLGTCLNLIHDGVAQGQVCED